MTDHGVRESVVEEAELLVPYAEWMIEDAV